MYEYRVKKITGVVDGDTIDVDIDLGFNIAYSQRVRLAGIDTPESRTTDKKEKALGLEVKQRLKDILAKASVVVIRTQKPDSTEKYGRVLGWLFVDGAEQSVNEALIVLHSNQPRRHKTTALGFARGATNRFTVLA
jgi:micrococcal nuclease